MYIFYLIETLQSPVLCKVLDHVLYIYIAPAWKISIHTLSSSSVGDNISCFRSLLYFSPHNLPLPLSFSVTSPVSILSSSCCLYPLFNMDAFSLLTIDNTITSPDTVSQYSSLRIHVSSPLFSMIRHFSLT